MTNDELSKMCGGSISPEERMRIIAEVKETGKDVREVIAQRTLPEMAILDANGKFFCEEYGGRITPAEWEERNPLGKYGRIVVITSRHHNTLT